MGAETPYVYVVIRQDLPLHHQVTQACHAALEIGFDHNRPGPPVHLVTLAVADEDALLELETHLKGQGIRLHTFYEPDAPHPAASAPMGFTALATEPLQGSATRRSLAHLPLWRVPAAVAVV